MADTDLTTTADSSYPITKSVIGRWADEPDDIPEEPQAPSTSSTNDNLNLNSLAIDESKKVNNFLEDPEDSTIQAVNHSNLFQFQLILLFLFIYLLYLGFIIHYPIFSYTVNYLLLQFRS